MTDFGTICRNLYMECNILLYITQLSQFLYYCNNITLITTKLYKCVYLRNLCINNQYSYIGTYFVYTLIGI